MEGAPKRRALVTGGSRGIGAAIARRLAADGFSVIVNYRSNHDAALAVKTEIESAGGEVTLSAFDVSDPEQTSQAIAALLDHPLPVSVVVNNAGVTADAAFPAMTSEQWHRVLETTLGGFYNVTHPLVMPMVRQKYGRVVNLSSISGLNGNRGQANYAAAKAGIIGATKSLAQELAKRRITVNAVAPGLIETDMLRDVPTEMVRSIIPMRRLGKPEEVAALVSFLAGEEAGYITGQVFRIDGGLW